MSDTPRTSAWYLERLARDEMFNIIQLVADFAAEEQCNAVTLEALAESERLRVESVAALNRANDATTKAEEQLRLSIIDAANNEADANDLRAERDEALRDVQQLHDAAVETEGKLADLLAYYEIKEHHDPIKTRHWHALIARIEVRRKP